MSNPAFKFDHVHIISEDPQASAIWYVEMFDAMIAANTMDGGLTTSASCTKAISKHSVPSCAARA